MEMGIKQSYNMLDRVFFNMIKIGLGIILGFVVLSLMYGLVQII